MRDVLRTLIEALEEGREQIFCQLVETKGSTPQKAGAVMVVDPAGGQTGTLGGGCVENEVKQLAIRQLGTVGTTLRSFVLDHDYAWADGLICGGKMVVAIEALRGQAPLRYLQSLLRLLEAGSGFTEAVIVDPERFKAEDQDKTDDTEVASRPQVPLRARWRLSGMLAGRPGAGAHRRESSSSA